MTFSSLWREESSCQPISQIYINKNIVQNKPFFWKQRSTEALRTPSPAWLPKCTTAASESKPRISKAKIRLWFYTVCFKAQKSLVKSYFNKHLESNFFLCSFHTSILETCKWLEKNYQQTLRSLFCFTEEEDLYNNVLEKEIVLIPSDLLTFLSTLVV